MKLRRKVASLMLAVIFLIGASGGSAAAAGGSRTITLLATSDVHGMLYPYDYAAGSETKSGLAKAAAIVKRERALDPDLLLVDNGDNTQANLISEFRNDEAHPAVRALNLMKYDTWTLGNHEFNFEFNNLTRSINAFTGTVIAANIYKADGSRWQAPYVIKEVGGVRTAIFGITAPHVPVWEKAHPEHYDGMTFTTPLEETGKVLKELEGKADVIICVIHYGMEGEYGVDGVGAVASTYADKIDAIIAGHAHARFAEVREYDKGSVAILEPGANGAYVGKITLEAVNENGSWSVANRTAELISTADTEPDSEFMSEMAYVHNAGMELSNKVLGIIGADFLESGEILPGIPRAVIEDTALVDLINIVQMEASGADVSMAALFDKESALPAGEFRFKDAVKVYKYDNTLYAVEITGKELKNIMEVYAGGFFNRFKEGDVTISFDPAIRLYNFDMFAGVAYQIDISKPKGERIVNLTYKNAPLADGEKLVLALNNYRYGALVDAGLIDGAREKIVYESTEAVRDMIGRYVQKKGTIYPVCDNNWQIIGYDFSDPQAELVYQMLRNGALTTVNSEDGRSVNIRSLNAVELRARGVLPPLETGVAAGRTYTVISGDSLWKIARKELGCGTKWHKIYKLNRDIIGNDPSKIQTGQEFVMPAA